MGTPEGHSMSFRNEMGSESTSAPSCSEILWGTPNWQAPTSLVFNFHHLKKTNTQVKGTLTTTQWCLQQAEIWCSSRKFCHAKCWCSDATRSTVNLAKTNLGLHKKPKEYVGHSISLNQGSPTAKSWPGTGPCKRQATWQVHKTPLSPPTTCAEPSSPPPGLQSWKDWVWTAGLNQPMMPKEAV